MAAGYKHKKQMGTIHPDIDRQNRWFNEYRIDAIQLGRMCEEFPGLQKSWEQFKTVFTLCKSQDEINRKIPPHLR